MWIAMKNSLKKLVGNEGRSINVIFNFSDQDVKAIRLATGKDVDEQLLEELVFTAVEDDLAVMYRILASHGVYFSEEQYDRAKRMETMN